MTQATAEFTVEIETETDAPKRLAAAAPQPIDDAEGELLDSPEQADLDMLCERWVYWCRTRRQYAPVASLAGILGKLTKSTRPMALVPHDPIASAELFAFNLAYCCQPEAIDKQAFDAHYRYRIKPIKVSADALGISRQHYYVLLRAFRQRVHIASKAILVENQRPFSGPEKPPGHTINVI